jgi:hypothetical protein
MSQTVKQTELLPQLRDAVDELHNYMVTLYLEDGRVGSSVLVNTCGFHGFLTAYHVAKPLLEFERFAVSIANYPHSLWIENKQVEHVPIGVMNDDEEKQKGGPDMSFLIIRDPKLIGILKSKKSFTFLDNQNLSIFEKPLDQVAWGIVGCPFHYRKIEGTTVGLHDFAGMAVFVNRTERAGFDYLELRMPCDGEKYPADFAGLSGGGMWATPLKAMTPDNDPKNIKHLRPVLAGVAYYQSAPNDGWRVVTGHGFDSVYKNLIQALKEKSSAFAC